MPPNPRDNLAHGQPVPRERVEDVIADALRPTVPGAPRFRGKMAKAVVDRLLYFRLLAPDVEGMNTGAHQRHLVEAGWLPPHRLERLREYVEVLRDSGALTEAGIIAEILAGGDPELPAPAPAPPREPCPEGFHWIGQSFACCDLCGLPAWEHAGRAEPGRGSGPFGGGAWQLRPWKPGEAEACKAKWGPRPAVEQPGGMNTDYALGVAEGRRLEREEREQEAMTRD